MRCKFCFATFQDVKTTVLPKGHLDEKDAIKIVNQLADAGFEKITFAGGEPTLCPWLPKLITTAKSAGMTTMIVSNGSRIHERFLIENSDILDWIAISIDSLNEKTNVSTGRALFGRVPLSGDKYLELVDSIKKHGYGLKINTVVHKSNFHEDMSSFISYAQPQRWKILEVLPIRAQNDEFIDDLKISADEFQSFVTRHKRLNSITRIVVESNEMIQGSYVMVDPAGRFFDNTQGFHSYSQPILDVGCREALKQVNLNISKFLKRGGIYNWARK